MKINKAEKRGRKEIQKLKVVLETANKIAKTIRKVQAQTFTLGTQRRSDTDVRGTRERQSDDSL